MTDPRFTDHEIARGVLEYSAISGGRGISPDGVRQILRAVGAVPARLLNGSVPAATFPTGAWVRGKGGGGKVWDGEVVESLPLTTTIRILGGSERVVWTNETHSHERP